MNARILNYKSVSQRLRGIQVSHKDIAGSSLQIKATGLSQFNY